MTKALLLLVVLVLLYLRVRRRQSGGERVCAGCGHRIPRHLTRCRNCSGQL